MATAPVLDLVPAAGNDIVVAVTQNPGIVLLDREKFDAWYEKLSAKAPEAGDMSVKKDRDALRSFAAEVRSEKAAIDKARLGMTKEWRDMVDQANAAGKEINQRLEGLAVEVRKPLTDWEEAEDARLARVDALILGMKEYAVVAVDDTSARIRERGTAVHSLILDPAELGDRLAEAETVKAESIATLRAALARVTQEDADRAELERLRAEAAERDRVEAEKAAAAEIERRRVEAERLAEERKAEAEKQEAARLEHMREEAVRLAREEEARKAREEQTERDRQHEEALAAERRRAEEAEAAAQAERDRVAAAEKAARDEAAAQAAREANRAHVSKVMREAKEAIMTCGATEEIAKAIVVAIKGGLIPNVSLEF